MNITIKNGTKFYSVETPSIFRECELPADAQELTKDDRKKWKELVRLAEKHGTRITASNYRRG